MYNDVIVALSKIKDESQQAALATILFGDNGLNVANVASLTAEEIAKLNKQMYDAGLVSSESAAKAGVIADTLDNIKQQAASASAELIVALMPTIMTLLEFVQEHIVPLLNTIAEWFSKLSPEQQKLLFFILMLVIIMPKLIGIISAIVGVIKAITIACYSVAGGVGSVSAASMPLQPILLAVSAAVLVLVLLFAMLAGKSEDVTGSLKDQQKQLSGMQQTYSDMAADMNATTEVVSRNSHTNYVEHNVNIKAEGDSAVSKETAELVAGDLANKINASLGGKI